MDREPSKLLDEAAELIAKASADTAGQAAQRASQATTLSLIVMLAVCAASVVGALLFSRSVVRTNANSVAGDPAKPRPGRRKRCCGRQPQATAAAAGCCGGILPRVCAGLGLSRPRRAYSVTGCGLGPQRALAPPERGRLGWPSDYKIAPGCSPRSYTTWARPTMSGSSLPMRARSLAA